MTIIRPHRGRCVARTPAQDAATQRNFLIFRLRGLYAQTFLLTGWRRKVAHWLIDRELHRLGAESQTKRRNQLIAKWKNDI